MCTLSLFKIEDGFQLFMNRDERHDRLAEMPPQIIKQQNSVYGPVDPVGGGTWIAHNEKGYWGCLLNGYLEQDTDAKIKNSALKSRGTILPDLLMQDNPLAALETFDPTHFVSFKLLLGSPTHYKLVQWDGKTFEETFFHASFEERIFFITSSSWEQENVIKTRKKLFEAWVKENQNTAIQTNNVPEYHMTSEPNFSSGILMKRSHAGTKSITALNINKTLPSMRYFKTDEYVEKLLTSKELEAA